MDVPSSQNAQLDEIFNAVDGRTVVLGCESWRLDVYNVQIIAACAWIQLAAVGRTNFFFTLRLRLPVHRDTTASLVAAYFEDRNREHEGIVDVSALPPSGGRVS